MSDPLDSLAWMTKAEEDLVLAMIARRRSPPLTAGACFHAQQCAEKYLKAILVARNQPFPYTHDLNRLFDLCLQAGVALAIRQPDLIALQLYAVEARYPGLTPSAAEARQAVLCAGRIRRVCRRVLGLS